MVPKSQWTSDVEHIFKGDIVIEYPHDESDPNTQTELQRIHLLATTRKPSIRLNLIPVTTLDKHIEQPSPDMTMLSEQPPLLIEFGYVHVESSMARTRAILLSNI